MDALLPAYLKSKIFIYLKVLKDKKDMHLFKEDIHFIDNKLS